MTRAVASWLPTLGSGLGLGVLLGALFWVIMLPWPGEEAVHRFCDQMVETLLTSHDPIEIERAGIVVREVPCSIWRRVPRS